MMFHRTPLRAIVQASLLALLLLCGVWTPALAAGRATAPEAVQLGPTAIGSLIGRQLQWLQDPLGQLSVDQVMAMPERFERSAHEVPSFGFTSSAYWFRVRLENRHAAQARWLLEAKYPLIDHFTFYTVRGTALSGPTQAGRMLPFAQRAVAHRNVLYPVQVASGETVDVYIRVHTRGSLLLPLALWTPEAFVARDHDEQIILGLYYGVLAAMLVYNLLIYLSIREISYLHYVHYIAGYLLFQLVTNGLAFEYLWPQWPQWGAIANPVFICLALVGGLNFGRSFLNLSEHMPRVARGFRGYAYGLVVVGASALFVPYDVVIKVATLGALVGVVGIVVAGSMCLVRGIRPARYFMLAWSVLLVGVALYVLKSIDVLPTTWLTQYGLQIGSALEVVLLSFALAQRMTLLKEENERIQAEATQQLEARVQQRTHELDEALAELSAANVALQAMSLTDGLTGIKNRKHFDAQLSGEIKRSTRADLFLSLLLIDIDFFKQVNDRHGHLAGDACLREVAKTVEGCLQRPSDVVARYGGEEFAVILPHTNPQGAQFLAEKIRQAVERLHFEFEGVHIAVTISIGCCSVVPEAGCADKDVIAAADAALYEAKHSGRNRVCLASAKPWLR